MYKSALDTSTQWEFTDCDLFLGGGDFLLVSHCLHFTGMLAPMLLYSLCVNAVQAGHVHAHKPVTAVSSAKSSHTFVLTLLLCSGMTSNFFSPDPQQLLATASFYGWIFFLIAGCVLIATSVQQWSFAVMGQALSRRVRLMLFKAMLRMEIG